MIITHPDVFNGTPGFFWVLSIFRAIRVALMCCQKYTLVRHCVNDLSCALPMYSISVVHHDVFSLL